MEFSDFKEFMLQSVAGHDARIAQIEESLQRVTNTLGTLVDNQVYLQERLDETQAALRDTQEAVRETTLSVRQTNVSVESLRSTVEDLAQLVMRHVSDPNGHPRPN